MTITIIREHEISYFYDPDHISKSGMLPKLPEGLLGHMNAKITILSQSAIPGDLRNETVRTCLKELIDSSFVGQQIRQETVLWPSLSLYNSAGEEIAIVTVTAEFSYDPQI